MPTPSKLKRIRKSLGISVKEASAMVYVIPRTWYVWESKNFKNTMPEALWELFQYKTGMKKEVYHNEE